MDQSTPCSTCRHSVYDPVWKEWRCKIIRHKLYHPIAVDDCLYCDDKNTEEQVENETNANR